ncbi:helix-turn-helix transcriptional regulator [Mesobacillus jeotgali]|jgi:transcriptional regulator with XRE-family HTH domain|uniref:Helix-turn-helix transcriptional regulator n=1 Tax=Mesobacillus jeotgali TaxID=129985 RepID=A0ABY9VIK6_9BACI|nr:helix-turn-helix transcriptional regulator [Mesobacillus jeotgali]WNF23493.1 helix-turn-helix transcriptional regulator [Mesobacillus jeotgali]
MSHESLGDILRMERLKRDLTQEKVCEDLGLKLNTLNRIESSKSVRGTTIKKLLNYYQMNKE